MSGNRRKASKTPPGSKPSPRKKPALEDIINSLSEENSSVSELIAQFEQEVKSLDTPEGTELLGELVNMMDENKEGGRYSLRQRLKEEGLDEAKVNQAVSRIMSRYKRRPYRSSRRRVKFTTSRRKSRRPTKKKNTTKKKRMPKRRRSRSSRKRRSTPWQKYNRWKFRNDNIVSYNDPVTGIPTFQYPRRGQAPSVGRYGHTWTTASAEQRQNRVNDGFYGDGDYKSFFRKVGKWGSRVVGGAYEGAKGWMEGGLGGMAKGAQTGWKRGGEFSKMMGWGDYQTGNMLPRTNKLINGPGISTIQVNPDDYTGDVFFSSSEFIQNVNVTIGAAGQSLFEIIEFPVNPGLSSTFPLLSQLAQNFELYDFQGLVFQYLPTSGESSAATNNAIGQVCMAVNYDPDAPAYLNMIQMQNYENAVTCKPSVEMYCGVETANAHSVLDLMFTRTGQSTKPLSFTDIGNLFIATEGIPGTPGNVVQIGQIRVGYRIRLSRANLFTSLLGGNIQTSFYTWTTTAKEILNPLDPGVTNRLESPNNQLDMGFTPIVGFPDQFQLSFPQNISLGAFRISLHFAGVGGGDFEFVQVATPNNCLFFLPGLATPSATPIDVRSNVNAAGSCTSCMQEIWVQVNAPGNSIASCIIGINPAVAGAGANVLRLTIEKVNVDFSSTLPTLIAF